MDSQNLYSEISSMKGGAAAYEGTLGPAKADEVGPYKQNTRGLHKPTSNPFVLTDFVQPRLEYWRS